MIRLNAVEQSCEEVLLLVRDAMAPGRKSLSPKDHMELAGRVRNALRKLEYKHYGCVLGLHSGPCQCKEDLASGQQRASTDSRERSQKFAPEDQSRQ